MKSPNSGLPVYTLTQTPQFFTPYASKHSSRIVPIGPAMSLRDEILQASGDQLATQRVFCCGFASSGRLTELAGNDVTRPIVVLL